MHLFRETSIHATLLGGSLLLGLGSAQTVPFNTAPLTLEDARARAMQAPGTVGALQPLLRAREGLRIAEAQAGLTLSAELQGASEWPTGTAYNGTALAQVNVSLPLGPSSGAALAVRQARLTLLSEEAQWRLTQGASLRQLTTTFGACLSTSQQRQLAATRLTLAEEQLRAAQSRADLGAATPGELLSAQLNLTLAQQALRQAEDAERDARLSLARQLGLASLPADPVLPPPDPQVAGPADLSAAARLSPGLVLARVQVEQARLNAERTELKARPTLSLEGSYIGGALTASAAYAYPGSVLQGGLGVQAPLPAGSAVPLPSGLRLNLSASFPLYDGGAALTERAGAERELAAARTALVAAQRDFPIQLDSAFSLLRLDQQGVQVQLAALDAARRTLAETRQRVQAGTITELEVLAVQVQLGAAEGSLLSAQLRLLDDDALLAALLGTGGTP